MSEVNELPDTFEAYSKSLANVEMGDLHDRVNALHQQMWADDMSEDYVQLPREGLLRIGWQLEQSKREIEASEVKCYPLCSLEDSLGGSSILIKVVRTDDALTENFVRRWVWAQRAPRERFGRSLYQSLHVYVDGHNAAVCEFYYVQDI